MTTNLYGLYGITNSWQLPNTTKLLAAVEAALKGGMRVLQYRDKSQDKDKRLEQASQLNALCQQYKATFIVNDDIHLADTVKADGVHLGQQDESITKARTVLGKHAIIGATCHGSVDLAIKASQQGANYLAFGRFFNSLTKPDAPLVDIKVLEQISVISTLPIVAIGGITIDNASTIIDAGAHQVAVSHGLFASDNIEKAAQQFTQLFSKSKPVL